MGHSLTLPQTVEVVVRLTMDDEDFDVNRLEERALKGTSYPPCGVEVFE
jgi:hypothetical protein